MANVIINDANLVAIGDAIRAKNGTTNTYKPREMADAITNLPTGGGGADIEPIVLTGDQSYCFANPVSKMVLDKWPGKITTENLTKVDYMFSGFPENSIPIELNFKADNYNSALFCFYNSNIVVAPRLGENAIMDVGSMFEGCHYLKDLTQMNLDNFTSTDYWGSSGLRGEMFLQCHSLRHLPSGFLEKFDGWGGGKSSYGYDHLYYRMFYGCYNLDEIINLGITRSSATITKSTILESLADLCYCLKHFTFKMNDDGTPGIAKWKSSALRMYVGCAYSQNTTVDKRLNEIELYAPERAGKRIHDATTYEALKDDPDAWVGSYSNETSCVPWSLYNIDSAVETINSLPDCSAYCGTSVNTIAFYRDAGSGYGKAINDLTEEQVAVATAKGWTVSLQ